MVYLSLSVALMAAFPQDTRIDMEDRRPLLEAQVYFSIRIGNPSQIHHILLRSLMIAFKIYSI